MSLPIYVQGAWFLGAALFIAVPEYLRVAREWRLVIFGATLVLMTLLMPRGIAGLIARARPSCAIIANRFASALSRRALQATIASVVFAPG